MRKILFTPVAFEQYNNWQTDNKQIFNRLKKLIVETAKTPFDCTGKPEVLKYEYAGCRFRRMIEEHRLIYKVQENVIEIIACKFHY